jgi:hypothetical protein
MHGPSGSRDPKALRVRRKFLKLFPSGFRDDTYIAWEREYKWNAHQQWRAVLSKSKFAALLYEGRHAEIAARAVRIESRTNLLFSFEKMALRDAVKTPTGARTFSAGLFDFLYSSPRPDPDVFERWCEAVGALPRVQTRVLTWPVVTVFGMVARPDVHIFLKPNVTKAAARAYGVDFSYRSRPAWSTYASVLAFAERVRDDVADLKPRDMIDLQSFIRVAGSDEY